MYVGVVGCYPPTPHFIQLLGRAVVTHWSRQTKRNVDTATIGSMIYFEVPGIRYWIPQLGRT